MVNPFYARHLETLMDIGTPVADETVCRQLYDWVISGVNTDGAGVCVVMNYESFKACLDLMLDRAEQSAMQEEASYGRRVHDEPTA